MGKLDLQFIISHEGATYLRDLGEQLPSVIRDLDDSTNLLINTYESLSEGVGPHSESFKLILQNIKAVILDCNDSFGIIQNSLCTTADRIDRFVDSEAGGKTLSRFKK